MSKPFIPTAHPVLRLPTAADAVALGTARWQEMMVRREEIIAREKADPFHHGWEPPIWRVCDALLGFPWVDPAWGEAMRRHLGFDHPVKTLLINGGNRGGKSQYCGKRTMRVLMERLSARGWAFHSSEDMSKEEQQPIFYGYLPAGLKGKDIKGQTTYVTYKQKTGFSDGKFVLPAQKPGMPGSEMLFKTYAQDGALIEGGNLDIVWPDELVPCDYVETLELRIAERDGWQLISFTPIKGYTATVALFQDGAETVKESVGFLLPRDGGPADVARSLGLSEAEYAEIQAAATHRNENGTLGRAAMAPQCVPENCEAWLEGKSGQPAIPEGRDFERVPRVMKCAHPLGIRAVVFFHSSDNPYGNPKSVWTKMAGKPREYIKERFYGLANKTLAARFAKFDRRVHVIPAGDVPARGTRYLFVDPCHGRNLFMLWFLVTPEHVYVYREWPGSYMIPGIGVPGPWAVPDGRKPDGRPGPGQQSFGWGLLAYKKEIARVEGWKDYNQQLGGHVRPEETKEENPLISWDEGNGASEVIEERFLDSRFASTPRMERDQPVTLLTEFEDIGLFFKPTPGDDIEEGARFVESALDYNAEAPVSYFNQPRLLVSSECVNLIYALVTWTGFTREGRRCMDGATKDPIDLLRYFFSSQCGYLGDGGGEEEEDEGKGHY